MRICEYNGHIIEAQSHATEGTLLANAERAGIIGAVERVVTAEDFAALLKAQRPAPTYAELRVKAYPPIGDQLDALFKAGVFPADMAIQLQAVKDAYPK